MEAQTVSTECYAKGCSEPSTSTCDRCGRSFCPVHVVHLVVQRREERSGRNARLSTLARLPTRAETYALCMTCRAKPVPCKSPPLAL